MVASTLQLIGTAAGRAEDVEEDALGLAPCSPNDALSAGGPLALPVRDSQTVIAHRVGPP